MISRARSTAGATLLALLLAATSPALAGASIFGKKKVEQDTHAGPQAHPGPERADRQGDRPREGSHQGRQGARSARRDLHPEHEAGPGPAPGPRIGPALPRPRRLQQGHQRRRCTSSNKGNFAAKKGKFAFFKNSLGALGGISVQPPPHLPRVRLRPDDPDGLERLRPPALHLHLHPQRLPRQHPDRRLRRLAHQRQARVRPLLRPHLGRDPRRQRRPLQRRLRRLHPDDEGVLPLR